MNNQVIANITKALNMKSDERVLANGGTFAEFQAAAIARWADAPLGEDAPESCPTILCTEAA